MQILWQDTPTKTMHSISHDDNSAECAKTGKNRIVNEMKQEVTQEYTEDDLETVSINSVCFNKSHLILTTKLKMSVDNNNMVLPYKTDTGSDGNIIPWYIFKNYPPG